MRVLEAREPFGINSVVFTTRPDPAAGPRDVVVRLNALSLNYRDMAKDEGHGFAKKKNADFQFYSTVQFMREFLLK